MKLTTPEHIQIEISNTDYERSEVEALLPVCEEMFNVSLEEHIKPDKRGVNTGEGRKPDFIYKTINISDNKVEIEHKRVFLPNEKYNAIHKPIERIYKYLIFILKTNGLYMNLKLTDKKKTISYETTKKLIDDELIKMKNKTNFIIQTDSFELSVAPILESDVKDSSVVLPIPDKTKGFLLVYHHEEILIDMLKKLTSEALVNQISKAVSKTGNNENSKFKKSDDIKLSVLLCSLSCHYGFELFFYPETNQLSFDELIWDIRNELSNADFIYDKIDLICLKKDYEDDIYILWANKK